MRRGSGGTADVRMSALVEPWWKGPGAVEGLYVHEARLRIDGAASDPAAPGAAITVALCGHWGHPPPCPLAAHHTSFSQDGDTVVLRIIFATAASDEGEVRRRIDGALALGALAVPGGGTARWILLAAGPDATGPKGSRTRQPHRGHIVHLCPRLPSRVVLQEGLLLG